MQGNCYYLTLNFPAVLTSPLMHGNISETKGDVHNGGISDS